jgi:hypothetical protein
LETILTTTTTIEVETMCRDIRFAEAVQVERLEIRRADEPLVLWTLWRNSEVQKRQKQQQQQHQKKKKKKTKKKKKHEERLERVLV